MSRARLLYIILLLVITILVWRLGPEEKGLTFAIRGYRTHYVSIKQLALWVGTATIIVIIILDAFRLLLSAHKH